MIYYQRKRETKVNEDGSSGWKRKSPAGRTTKSWRRCIPSKTKTENR
nr:MAG TPA: hypothetical protein [Caudoviricetes sp.]